MIDLDVNEQILLLSIKKLTSAFNEFIAYCVDENGKPKSPTYKELMKARGYLTSDCSMSLTKNKKS